MTKVAEQLVKQLRRAESHERLEIVFEVLQALAENGKAPFCLGGTRGDWVLYWFKLWVPSLPWDPANRTSNPFRRNKSQDHVRSWPKQHMRKQRKEGESTISMHFSRSKRQQIHTYSPWWVRGRQQRR